MVNGAIKYENGKAIHRVWTIGMIQEELARLDEITGLHGRDIPCILNERMSSTLGIFRGGSYVKKIEKNMLFSFSKAHFTEFEGTGTELSRLDTVRHEYAHYYAFVALKSEGVHDDAWREACRVVDCCPILRLPHEHYAYLERLDAMYPDCIPLNPMNPMKEFRMSYENALWALEFHPVFSRYFLDHLTVVRIPHGPESLHLSGENMPQVLLKAERLNGSTGRDCGQNSWIYDPRLDTCGNTYEDAIIELAHKVIRLFRW